MSRPLAGGVHDRLESDIDPRWLHWWTFYAARDPQWRRDAARTGAVPGSPLPEQRRIAEVLDAVAGAIRATEAVVAKLEKVEAGLRQDLAAAPEDVVAPTPALLAACADRIRADAEVLRKLRCLQQGLLADLLSRRF